jgi:hypothetical protein
MTSSGAIGVAERGSHSHNRTCCLRDFDIARRRACPGTPGAGNPHAGFQWGGEAQGRPRPLSTNHRVNHDKVMSEVSKRVQDGRVWTLIHRFLTAGAREHEALHETGDGVSQGGPRSPLLSGA